MQDSELRHVLVRSRLKRLASTVSSDETAAAWRQRLHADRDAFFSYLRALGVTKVGERHAIANALRCVEQPQRISVGERLRCRLREMEGCSSAESSSTQLEFSPQPPPLPSPPSSDPEPSSPSSSPPPPGESSHDPSETAHCEGTQLDEPAAVGYVRMGLDEPSSSPSASDLRPFLALAGLSHLLHLNLLAGETIRGWLGHLDADRPAFLSRLQRLGVHRLVDRQAIANALGRSRREGSLQPSVSDLLSASTPAPSARALVSEAAAMLSSLRPSSGLALSTRSQLMSEIRLAEYAWLFEAESTGEADVTDEERMLVSIDQARLSEALSDLGMPAAHVRLLRAYLSQRSPPPPRAAPTAVTPSSREESLSKPKLTARAVAKVAEEATLTPSAANCEGDALSEAATDARERRRQRRREAARAARQAAIAAAAEATEAQAARLALRLDAHSRLAEAREKLRRMRAEQRAAALDPALRYAAAMDAPWVVCELRPFREANASGMVEQVEGARVRLRMRALGAPAHLMRRMQDQDPEVASSATRSSSSSGSSGGRSGGGNHFARAERHRRRQAAASERAAKLAERAAVLAEIDADRQYRQAIAPPPQARQHAKEVAAAMAATAILATGIGPHSIGRPCAEGELQRIRRAPSGALARASIPINGCLIRVRLPSGGSLEALALADATVGELLAFLSSVVEANGDADAEAFTRTYAVTLGGVEICEMDSQPTLASVGLIGRCALLVRLRDKIAPQKGQSPPPPRRRVRQVVGLRDSLLSELAPQPTTLALPGNRLIGTLHGRYTFDDSSFRRSGMLVLLAVADDDHKHTSRKLLAELQPLLHFQSIAFLLPTHQASGARARTDTWAADIEQILRFLHEVQPSLTIKGLVGHGQAGDACLLHAVQTAEQASMNTGSQVRQPDDVATTRARPRHRRCPGHCGYLATWHSTHCCRMCEACPGMHGPHCEGMLANPLPSQHGVRELCLLGCSHEEAEEGMPIDARAAFARGWRMLSVHGTADTLAELVCARAFAAQHRACGAHRLRLLSGADHLFSGQLSAVAEAINDWHEGARRLGAGDMSATCQRCAAGGNGDGTQLLPGDELVTHVSLSGCRPGSRMLGCSGALLLSEELRVDSSVRYLDLSSNNIRPAGARALAAALEANETLSSLELAHNVLLGPGARAIANALRAGTSLTRLGLRACGIGASGAVALAAALATERCALTSLNLRENAIMPCGGAAIAAALKSSSMLMELDLGENALKETGASAIAEALAGNGTLTALGMRHNGLRAATAKIAHALAPSPEAGSPALVMLDLRDNDLFAADAQALSVALTSNSSMVVLELGLDTDTLAAAAEAVTAIGQVLSRNRDRAGAQPDSVGVSIT